MSDFSTQAFMRLVERHRANGCRVFDDKFAICTCDEKVAESSWESEGGYYKHED